MLTASVSYILRTVSEFILEVPFFFGKTVIFNNRLLLLLLSRFSRVWLCATHRRQPTRLLRPWDSPGKNTGVGCHCLLQCMKVKSESEVAQSHPTLRNPMDCSLPGSSVHGTSQASVLEWVAIARRQALSMTWKEGIRIKRIIIKQRVVVLVWGVLKLLTNWFFRLLWGWKLQYFGHLMWRADSLEKTLMLRKIEDKRRSG